MMRRLLTSCFVTLLASLSASAADVDRSPLPVTIEPAFGKLTFKRPIVLTHAGDGTDRVFVASQLGAVYVFPNDQSVGKAALFLDISKRVVYKDKENEEGFLGMAFHPNFKLNGEFFVYYTSAKAPPHTSVISRFRVSKNNPNQADPNFEEEILRIPQPYWNHTGGTIVFGPDGYLYIGLGDGGSANDPHGNGQNMQTLLGKVLRIDVDRQDPGKQYAIPKDNPFAAADDQKADEIWASGIRNIWRMSFDRETGVLWAGDVGQDTWEEIDLIVRGGNYGWNIREGLHPFVPKRGRPRPDANSRTDLIDPIWEYHHDEGKSITGGHVYRGQQVPELAGKYLYADYVTGKVYALNYDAQQKRVTANHTIPGNIKPVMSFGEDERGEVYFLTDSGSLYRFRSGK
jgi:quinoprotein glucose dehydrogenase